MLEDDKIKLFSQMIENKILKKIINDNNLDKEVVNNKLNYENISEYLNWCNVKCDNSGTLQDCKQLRKGLKHIITYKNGLFYISFKDCEHNKKYKQGIEWETNFISKNFSNEFIKNFDKNKLGKAYSKVIKLTEDILLVKENKGFFFKSKEESTVSFLKFVSFRIASSKKQEPLYKKSIIIDNSTSFLNACIDDSKIKNTYKKVDILFIEDLGEENISPWSIGVLYDILSFRLHNCLMTFLGSSLSLKNLEDKYKNSKSKNGESNREKGIKLINVIKSLTSFVELK